MHLPYHNKRIIVAPLCWGLGHATRCMSVIDVLLKQGCEVALASDSEALFFLRREYPHLQWFSLPPYDVHYKYASMPVNMALQSVKLWKAINAEKEKAQQVCSEWNPAVVISDNRLGFRAKGVHNIYLTHQLQVMGGSGLGTAVASYIHRSYYSRFDELWVPDYVGMNSMAGRLSQVSNISKSIRYLGPLSRFEYVEVEKDIDILAVLSGPEPQRTYLEELLVSSLGGWQRDYSIVIVRGSTMSSGIDYPTSVKKYDLLQSKELNSLISRSRVVIARSGYSSIMDFATLRSTAILIPTPGQHEQMYLANHLDGKHRFHKLSQSKVLKGLRAKIESLLTH